MYKKVQYLLIRLLPKLPGHRQVGPFSIMYTSFKKITDNLLPQKCNLGRCSNKNTGALIKKYLKKNIKKNTFFFLLIFYILLYIILYI